MAHPKSNASMSVDTLFMQGVSFHQQGQLGVARSAYEQVLKLKPQHFDALHLLGVIEHQSQRPERAVDLITRALAIKPYEPGVHANLGLPLVELGRHTEALRCFEQAIALQPDFAEAHYNRGNALMRLRRTDEAAKSFERAIEIRPAHAKSHYNLGIAKHELKQFELSVKSYERAIAIWPDYAEAYSNRGNALQALERHEEALASYDRALALKADYTEAHSNRGNALLQLDRVEEAMACFERAIALEPNYAEAHSNLGNAWLKQLQPKKALVCYEQALALKPDQAEAHNNKGEALRYLGQPDLALRSYKRAIQINPRFDEAYLNLALGLLAAKKWDQGWDKFKYRKSTANFSKINWLGNVPLWQAGQPKGRLLVVTEQGIGDEVFLSKSLGLFIQHFGAPACVLVDPRLVVLFTRSFPHVRFVARSDVGQLTPQEFDLQMAMGDMPALLLADPIQSPVLSHPHLQPDTSKPDFLSTQKQRPRLGVAWKSKNAKFGAEKSMTLMQLMGVFKDLDVDWINLQYGDVSEEIEQVRSALGVAVKQVPEVDVNNDLDAWLKLIAECDFVLTTSNSTAHFAGAIGKPSVVMAPFGKGKLWYWHPEDGPSLWYPSLQVFHAQKHQGWETVLPEARNWLDTQLQTLS